MSFGSRSESSRGSYGNPLGSNELSRDPRRGVFAEMCAKVCEVVAWCQQRSSLVKVAEGMAADMIGIPERRIRAYRYREKNVRVDAAEADRIRAAYVGFLEQRRTALMQDLRETEARRAACLNALSRCGQGFPGSSEMPARPYPAGGDDEPATSTGSRNG